MPPHPPSSSPEAASLDEIAVPNQSGRTSAPPRVRPTGLGWLAFASVGLFWGTSAPLLRYTVRYVDPLTLVVLRFFIAGTVLWLGLCIFGRRPPIAGLPKILLSGIALAFTNVLVTFGFQRIEAGAGTLMLGTTAVAFAVVDIAWPGGKAKPSASVWLGLLLGLVGVAVLSISPRSIGTGQWQGYLMLALSTWFWALASVAQARYPSGQDPIQSSAWQMLLAATFVFPVAAFAGHLQLRGIPWQGWCGILALVVTASIIAFVSFIYMLRQLPPFAAGAYTYVNSIVAAGLGVVWLGEQLSARVWLAALLVLGGVALIQRRA